MWFDLPCTSDLQLTNEAERKRNFENKSLDELKMKVGHAKLTYGADPWMTAANFVDPYSGLSQLHRAPSRAYFKLVEIGDLTPSPTYLRAAPMRSTGRICASRRRHEAPPLCELQNQRSILS